MQSKNARRRQRQKEALKAATCAILCERLHPLPRATPSDATKTYGLARALPGTTLLVDCAHCPVCRDTAAAENHARALDLYRPRDTCVTLHGVLHTDPRGFIFASSFTGRVSDVCQVSPLTLDITIRLYDAGASFPITDAQARVYFKADQQRLRLTMPDTKTREVRFSLGAGEATHPSVIVGAKCKQACATPCPHHDLRLPEFVQ